MVIDRWFNYNQPKICAFLAVPLQMVPCDKTSGCLRLVAKTKAKSQATTDNTGHTAFVCSFVFIW